MHEPRPPPARGKYSSYPHVEDRNTSHRRARMPTDGRWGHDMIHVLRGRLLGHYRLPSRSGSILYVTPRPLFLRALRPSFLGLESPKVAV
jgi:hypothetical protein